MAPSAAADDGVLDLRLFLQGSPIRTFGYYYNLWWGSHERLTDVKSIPVRRVRMEADVPVPIQLDGDPQGWTPAEFDVLPAAIEVVVP
jgi:diacylglycerol kinase family enzyme